MGYSCIYIYINTFVYFKNTYIYVIVQKPDWKKLHKLFDKLASPGIMGDQLHEDLPSTPRNHSAVMFEGHRGSPQLGPHEAERRCIKKLRLCIVIKIVVVFPVWFIHKIFPICSNPFFSAGNYLYRKMITDI